MLIGLSIIKDEADILPYWYEKNSQVFDGIVAIDNGSKDNSLGLLKSFPNVWRVERDTGEFNEKRLTKRLVEMAKGFNAEWYAELDGDEIFPVKTRQVVESCPDGYNVITCRILYMPGCYRHKEKWPRIFRNQDFSFDHLKKEHGGKIPIEPHLQNRLHSNLNILHYPIRSAAHANLKYQRHTAGDPFNRLQPQGYDWIKEFGKKLEEGTWRS